MSESMNFLFSEQLFHHLQDGIIIMDEERHIYKMNAAAKQLMGWDEGDVVPYCTYCENRPLDCGEPRCYLLANKGDIPYFSSQMPNVAEYMVNIEMSNVLVYEEEVTHKKYYLLMLRDRTLKQKEEEAEWSRLILKRLTEAREDEHKRLSQELHDGIGQSLYSVAIAMDHLTNTIEEERLKTYIGEVRQEVGKAMEEVKFYSQSLRPKSLDQLGLLPTIKSLVQSVEKKMPNLSIRLSVHGEHAFDQLSSVAKTNIYRVVQEAIHNIMKYADASLVDITFHKTSFGLSMTIQDDGVGFDVEQHKNGLGLIHIVERIAQLEGTTSIESTIGEGTRIQMYVPNKGLNGGVEWTYS